jgi:hypothetical protein
VLFGDTGARRVQLRAGVPLAFVLRRVWRKTLRHLKAIVEDDRH